MRGFVLMKPEVIQRNLVGKIITMLENKGLKIVAIKMLKASDYQIRTMYKHLESLDFFEKIILNSTDGPVIAMVLESVGEIDPNEILTLAQGKLDVSGSIRYLFVTHQSRNVIHCSDNAEMAEKEINLFFSEDEIIKYTKVLDEWLIEKN
jgi:nucleoside-diphosphate kinase